MGTVRCVDCGFYSRRHMGSGELACADEGYRRSPEFGINLPGDGYYQIPVCAMGVPEFSAGGDLHEQFEKSRNCSEFTPWIPALTPREHSEMLREQDYRFWQERQADRQQRSANRSLGVAVAGIIVAALINLAGQWIPKPAPTIHVVLPASNAVDSSVIPNPPCP